ncbi:helix-turn-helix domain-containing protein [Wenjunlia vitaminophila]|uniref:helix-turn-helix domain-containing protein n=1 Tax=Wenjunlia vitaminophila TaxID=76728 RepID=UPI00037CBE7D|nr:helix-turn-helix domain-containing protein [Wenjunlia vitaminophila]
MHCAPDPDPLPALRVLLRAARRARGLSQQQVATALGVDLRTYRRWETGGRRMPPARVDAVATVVRMTLTQRDRLHQLAVGRLPDPEPVQAADPALVDPHYLAMIAAQTTPCYLVTTGWNLIAANQAFKQFFWWVNFDDVPVNLVPAVIAPEAQQALADWERSWGGPIMAQIWAAHLAHPHHPVLRREVARLMESPDPAVRRAWAAREQYSVIHPDTSERPIRHPAHGGLIRVVILSSVPESMRERGFRLLVWRYLT